MPEERHARTILDDEQVTNEPRQSSRFSKGSPRPHRLDAGVGLFITLVVSSLLVGIVMLAFRGVKQSSNMPLSPLSTVTRIASSASSVMTGVPALGMSSLIATPLGTTSGTLTLQEAKNTSQALSPLPTPGEPSNERSFPIGYSIEGRPLMMYRLGLGPVRRMLIGAIHGGYEWNTALLMSRTLEYLSDNPTLIPYNLTLYILPIANPDGYAAGTDRVNGRMNANMVDLNRNWDYQWQITATHGTNPVSAGTVPFSEPETAAMRDFIMSHHVEAVIFYHSAFAAVFQGAGITTSKTIDLAKLIATQTGYRYAPEGVPGQITSGDSIDWLTVKGVTAIEVELTTHQTLDWEQNRRGLLAFINWDLPQTAAATPPVPPTLTPDALSVTGPLSGQRVHVVASGDTLYGIAAQYDVSIDDLLEANDLKIDTILRIGQKIIIPSP